MLTADEEKFVAYWSQQRTQPQRPGYNRGLRLGALMVIGIFVMLATGWHKPAMMALGSDSSTILVILIAAVAIVVFISLFAGRYQWEQREQRYNELLAKKSRNA